MPSAGQVIRAADVTVQACRVTRTTSQSIPNGADTTVAFTSEQFDNNAMHNNSTNNSRITINEPGLYTVGFCGRLASASTYTSIVASIVLNGSSTIVEHLHPGTSIGVTQRITVSTMDEFVANDYIEVVIYQTSGSARNLEVAGDFSPVFWAARIGS